MITLQWQRQNCYPYKVWVLLNISRNSPVAFAWHKGGRRGVGGIYPNPTSQEIEPRTGPGVHKLRETISKEIDRRSIGLFGDDDVTFLPSLIIN